MRTWLLITLTMLVTSAQNSPAAVRIKDVTRVDGARSNQLYGVGLVVGLKSTGGRSLATQQMAIDMLRRMDVTTKIARQGLLDNVFFTTNVSMVMVTAELSAFSREGSRVDVSVSVLDDASSLRGGTLLLTPLKGADGEVYAVAQGAVSIGGYHLTSQAGQTALFNHPNVGYITDGAIVEKEALGSMSEGDRVRLNLTEADFDTAEQIARVINEKFAGQARTLDAGTVEIMMTPTQRQNVVGFIGECGNLEISPDSPARIIINERTGTVIVGHTVKISTVAIAHGSLVIRPEEERQETTPLGPAAAALLGIQQDQNAANQQQQQPEQLAPGQTPSGDKVNVVEETMTVAEFARALNALGTAPRDLIAIFQALKRSGALHAELVLM